MSLSSILNAASAGIANTEYKINVTNNNIANADDPNYTVKRATSAPLTALMALSSAAVTRAADDYLTKAVVTSSSDSARDQAISTSLQNYDAALGSVSSGNDLASRLTALQTALTNLSSNGGTVSDKASVAAVAQRLADSIRGLSNQVQNLRSSANVDIGNTVTEINGAASQIVSLNHQIMIAQSRGDDVTNLEDQRDAALKTLSQDIGVTFYTTPTNQIQVFTTGGVELVGQNAKTLSYTAASSLSATTTYSPTPPSQISGIMVDGQDITTSISTGKLAGLITLRDQTYQQEQAKLDTFAQTLMSQVNTASNAGTAYPPPSTLTSTGTFAVTDPVSAMGTLRVAVTDKSGVVQSTLDIDMTTVTTVGDVIAQLNTVPGLTASINAQGKLTLSTAANQGVALADIGAMVAPNGAGVSAYFGLNDLFTGTGASDIALNASIASTPSNLPSGSLSKAALLPLQQVGIGSADTTATDAINAALSTATSIPAAGNFPAQTSSLQSYVSSLVANAATLIANAASQASTTKATYNAANTQLQNLTSVNTDEEMAHLTAFQQQYQANAQLISTVRTLFNTLMQMMNN